MTASSQQSDQGSPLTGIGRLVLLILATIIITHINFPHLFIEPTAEEWYEPQWVSPDEYKQYLVDVIKNPSSTVIWGFGGGKKLQTTAESIQQEISEQYPSCTMWVDSKRFNWQIQQEIFDMMSCEKGAILLQVEGDLLDKDILKFIEAIVDAPPVIHYNGKKKNSVPVTVIGYSTIPKGEIRIASEIVRDSIGSAWSKAFLEQYVTLLVVS